MNHPKTRILLIEDDAGDALLIEQMLAEEGSALFDLERVDRLATGIEHLKAKETDLILLDLGLPDSQGLDGLITLRGYAGETPIVVLTGLTDEAMGTRILREGAQDYLLKEEINHHLLTRAIRYAIERHRLLTELDRAKEEKQRDREMRSLDRLGGPGKSSVTAQTFGFAPLGEAHSDAFKKLLMQYGDLMDQALEQQAFKVDHNVSEQLREMAENLGFLRAGPRDVVEIHSTVLKMKKSSKYPQKAQAYMEEGRLMVLELMGNLVSYYRGRAV